MSEDFGCGEPEIPQIGSQPKVDCRNLLVPANSYIMNTGDVIYIFITRRGQNLDNDVAL